VVRTFANAIVCPSGEERGDPTLQSVYADGPKRRGQSRRTRKMPLVGSTARMLVADAPPLYTLPPTHPYTIEALPPGNVAHAGAELAQRTTATATHVQPRAIFTSMVAGATRLAG
jgi:hypothetical protein